MTQAIKAKFAALASLLDEQTRRRWAAMEVRAIGRGRITRVAEAKGAVTDEHSCKIYLFEALSKNIQFRILR